MRKALATILAGLAASAAFAAPATAAPSRSSSCHQEYAGSGPCQPDTGHCASYFEQTRIRLDMRRIVVWRTLGTPGRRVGKHALDRAAWGVVRIPGVKKAPLRFREVKLYPTCGEDGAPARLFVEFEVHHGVGRVTRVLWI